MEIEECTPRKGNDDQQFENEKQTAKKDNN